MARGAFDLDPEELRRLGHDLVDRVVEALEEERRDPVLPPCDSAALHARHAAPLPREGVAPALRGELLADLIAPARRKNGHPRFFGYICPSADPLGILADLAASASNQNVTAWRSAPAATEMERQVLRWLGELVGFDGDGEGVLTSGGSMANLIAVSAAVLGRDSPRERQVLYGSQETHFSLRKAARLLGIQARPLPVDDRRRLSVDALRAALAEDRAAGRVPACICASAGTTNTGAVDPLEEVAALARAAGVWLHVDGAYGAPAAATASHAWMRPGLAAADSLSVDPHKWLFAPFDVGALLLRDGAAARRAFEVTDEYARVVGESEVERHTFYLSTPELSRRARAAKVWAILRGRGADALAAEIERQIGLRAHLDARVAAEPRLEALGSGLSIACFRYRPAGADEVATDEANHAIRARLQASGRFLLSPTTVDGKVALRVCIVNFRTRPEDLDDLVASVLAHGAGDER